MNVRTALNLNHWSGAIEFTIESRNSNQVVAKMPVHPGILNAFGTVHAGALVWFADVTATLCAVGEADDIEEDGRGFPLAIDIHAALAGNEREGVLTAEARPVRRGGTLVLVRTVVTGPSGRLLMNMTTTHMRAR